MNASLIIPLVSQLLTLGFKIADVIETSKEVSAEDKVAMKVAITEARDNVKYWDDKEESNSDVLAKD